MLVWEINFVGIAFDEPWRRNNAVWRRQMENGKRPKKKRSAFTENHPRKWLLSGATAVAHPEESPSGNAESAKGRNTRLRNRDTKASVHVHKGCPTGVYRENFR